QDRRTQDERLAQRHPHQLSNLVSSHAWFSLSPVLRKALEQRVSQKVPAIHHDEQQNLQRGGDGHGRQLQHADGGGDGRNNQIDQQERQEEDGANLKACLQLRKHVRRNDHPHRQVHRRLRPRYGSSLDEQRQVFFARVMQHELLGRLNTSLHRLPSGYLPLLEWLNRLLIHRYHHRLHQEP